MATDQLSPENIHKTKALCCGENPEGVVFADEVIQAVLRLWVEPNDTWARAILSAYYFYGNQDAGTHSAMAQALFLTDLTRRVHQFQRYGKITLYSFMEYVEEHVEKDLYATFKRIKERRQEIAPAVLINDDRLIGVYAHMVGGRSYRRNARGNIVQGNINPGGNLNILTHTEVEIKLEFEKYLTDRNEKYLQGKWVPSAPRVRSKDANGKERVIPLGKQDLQMSDAELSATLRKIADYQDKIKKFKDGMHGKKTRKKPVLSIPPEFVFPPLEVFKDWYRQNRPGKLDGRRSPVYFFLYAHYFLPQKFGWEKQDEVYFEDYNTRFELYKLEKNDAPDWEGLNLKFYEEYGTYPKPGFSTVIHQYRGIETMQSFIDWCIKK
ncbi:MAG: hypothetical protein LBR83_01975 [Clostridiales bacterium]|nr:hypothetical protein [Clostridiales bacterium]